MADQGDYLQVKVKQLLGGTRNFENIFHYRATIGAPSVEALAEAMEAVVSTAWRTLCTAQLTFETLIVENLFDPDDFIEYDLGSLAGTGAGTVGETLAGFVAMGVDIPNDRRSIRPSSKRLYVGGESVLGGDLWDSTWLAGDVANVAAILGSTLTDTSTDPDTLYRPITVKRIRVVDGVTGKVTYRLPVSASEASHAYWTAFNPKPVATSQVSRRGKIES